VLFSPKSEEHQIQQKNSVRKDEKAINFPKNHTKTEILAKISIFALEIIKYEKSFLCGFVGHIAVGFVAYLRHSVFYFCGVCPFVIRGGKHFSIGYKKKRLGSFWLFVPYFYHLECHNYRLAL